MRVAIIAAMEEEVHYLRQQINNYESYDFQGYTYHIGDIMEQSVVVVQSGIGKVNAAMSTVLLLEHFSVSEVINTGSAGGIDTTLNIGDVIIGNDTVYHDVDATAFGYVYGQVPKMPQTFPADDKATLDAFIEVMDTLAFDYRVGLIASGDSFVTDSKQIKNIRVQYPNLLAVDMEATAIAQVCYQYMIPVVVVRSISDIVDSATQNSSEVFKKYIDTAAKHSTEVIVSFLKKRGKERSKTAE